MANLLKHIGQLENTGKQVVVVFMSLPNDEENALVVDTDALPDQYNEALRKIVESVEGQQSKDLGEILGRRPAPDGSSLTMLQKLHAAQRLMKVPVDLVHMTPARGMKFPLRQILSEMKKVDAEAPLALEDLDPITRAQVIAEMGKFNVHQSNMEGTTADGRAQEARELIRMAEMLEADATARRAQAYAIDPTLNPVNRRVQQQAAEILSDANLEPVVSQMPMLDTHKAKAPAKAMSKSTVKKAAIG
jgi:hypothetical protein